MEFDAIVEIQKASHLKYEQDKKTGLLVLDRVLAIPCPHNYGFIAGLPLQADGDPLDAFILSFEPLVPLSQVKIRPLGIFVCEDNGVEDNKVVGQIVGDFYRDFDYIKSIRFYLENYKTGFKILEYKVFNDEALFKNYVGGFK